MKSDTSAKVNSCKDETAVNAIPYTSPLYVLPLPERREKVGERKDTGCEARQKMVDDKNCRRWSKRRGERLPGR